MKEFLKNIPLLTLGAMIAAISIEILLVPYEIIDGGVVGISIMFSYLTNIELGIFTFVLNLPFLLIAWKIFGKKFVFYTLYSIAIMSITIAILGKIHFVLKGDLLLATVFGGVILGFGVGLVLRSNGSLDGTEILSIVLSKKLGLSVGQIIMIFNFFIFIAAGFVFEPNRAMYSMLTYFLAFKVIDMVLEGFDDSKSVRIVTDYAIEIGNSLIKNLNVSVTYIDAIGGYSHTPKKIIYCVIARLELNKLKEIVQEIDSNAFIAIENVHEVEGRRFKKTTKTF